MEISYDARFNRDMRQIRNATMTCRVEQVIKELKAGSNITEIRGVRKLRAEGRHYRIRIGNYRLGITMAGDTVILARFLPRSEIYRHFP